MRKGECIEKADSDFFQTKRVSVGFGKKLHGQVETREKEEALYPAWDGLDGSVLRFYAFAKHSAYSGGRDVDLVREFVILYYLVDDTVSIFEPKVPNSGMNQGVFLKRSRIDTFDIAGVQIGENVTIHGHEFRILDADKFTRDYYLSEGKRLFEPMALPGTKASSNTENSQVQGHVKLESLGKSIHVDSRKEMQYLENDKKVCRFFAVLREDAEARFFIIFFFLADGSVEIREKVEPNSGRHGCSLFFRRGKLDSYGDPCSKERPALDLGAFNVGSEINLCFKKFFLFDADSFTRDWFASRLKIVLRSKIDVQMEPSEKVVRNLEQPEYTGFGSWEDSLGSVQHLCPKQPKRDAAKMFFNEGKVLRFKCRFESPKMEDRDRRFVLSFHLGDDQVSIHEPCVRNSGILGGRFLEKGVYLNELTKEILSQKDLKIGNVIEIAGRRLVLEECDSFTSRFFEPSLGCAEEGRSILPIANEVQRKLVQLMPKIHDTFRRVDKDGTDRITVDKFREILQQFGFVLSADDCLQLMRIFDANQNGLISYQEFCDALSRENLGLPSEFVSMDDYKKRTTTSLENQSENALRTKAGKHLTEVLHARSTLSQRLMKELGTLSNQSKFINSDILKRALDNLGIRISQADLERIIDLAKKPEESHQAFDHFEFLKKLRILFHTV